MKQILRAFGVKKYIFLATLGLLGSAPAWAAPVISDFSPSAGPPGTSVTISGSGLANVTEVHFGTALAIFDLSASGQVVATVPLDATTGPITIVTTSGAAISSVFFLVAPRITGFSPSNGPPRAEVLVNGFNFEGTTSVDFNGTNATFFVTGANQLHTIVPDGARSGPIRVTSPAGSALSPEDFLVTTNQPLITSFSPTNGSPGTVVILDGFNFTGTTAVRFNGTNAPAFAVTAPTQIRVTLPANASSGPISVTTAFGTGMSIVPFIVTTAPVITDFTPFGGPAATTVVINGLNFLGATSVKFNGTNAASFAVTAATQIHAAVQAGASPGPITVTTPLGTGSSSDIFFAGSAPLITDFTPSSGLPGTTVSINGLNFTGATSVKFGGANAKSFGVTAPTQISAVVPAGATNGPLVITTPAGTATSADPFLVRTGKPRIIGFTPGAGLPGTTVTIEGVDFTGTTAVKFNGASANFSLVADSQISALLPAAATTGPISVSTPSGIATSAVDFVAAPRLSTFTPASGPSGTSVTIQGTNFTHLIAVRLGTVSLAFTNKSPNEIVAVVAPEAITGSIILTSPGGIVASPGSFLVLPTITQFTPANGPVGTAVNILGTGFGGVTSVAFGGVPVASFNVLSATQIVAMVPDRALSGPITVTTTSGTAASQRQFGVGAAADLALTQSTSTNSLLQNQLWSYTLSVTNLGPSVATSVLLSNSIPTGALLLSAVTTTGQVVRLSNYLRVTLPSLAVGSSLHLTVSVLSQSAGTLVSAASVSATEIDPDLTNNSQTISIPVLPNPAILQAVELPPGEITLSWPVAATNFVLQSTETLDPADWQPVSATPVVSANRKNVTLPIGEPPRFFRLERP